MQLMAVVRAGIACAHTSIAGFVLSTEQDVQTWWLSHVKAASWLPSSTGVLESSMFVTLFCLIVHFRQGAALKKTRAVWG